MHRALADKRDVASHRKKGSISAHSDGCKLAEVWISNLCHRAEIEKNPLYLWEAILRCHINRRVLPPICREYVAATAIEIYKLRGAVERGEQTAAMAMRGLGTALQMNDGQRGTKNAFTRYVDAEEAEHDVAYDDAEKLLSSLDPSPNPRVFEPVEARIKRRQNVESERTIRRQLIRGRKLRDRN